MMVCLKISFHDTDQDEPRAALSVQFKLAANETRSVEFLLTWDFPNRKDWDDKTIIGNYYSTLYNDAWDVAEKTLPQITFTRNKDVRFCKSYCKQRLS